MEAPRTRSFTARLGWTLNNTFTFIGDTILVGKKKQQQLQQFALHCTYSLRMIPSRNLLPRLYFVITRSASRINTGLGISVTFELKVQELLAHKST